MYHWAKNAARDMMEATRYYRYKGLDFCRVEELDTEPPARNFQPKYAFFGCRHHLTRAQIRERVDMMIARGQYIPPKKIAA